MATKTNVIFQILTVVLIKIWVVFWDILLLKLVATNVSKELAASTLGTVKEEVKCAVSEDGGSKVLCYAINYLPIYTTSTPKKPES
jgi:hypothetical protein